MVSSLGLTNPGIQSSEYQRSAQGVNNAEDLLEAHSGLASLQIDDETHPHSCGQRKIRLGQAHALPGIAQRGTQRLGIGNGGHGWIVIKFPFGKLCSNYSSAASEVYRSGIKKVVTRAMHIKSPDREIMGGRNNDF
jgi:hypothetical protein